MHVSADMQRVANLQRTMALLVHASACNQAQCNTPDCHKVKTLFKHGVDCPKKAAGGCHCCRRVWYADHMTLASHDEALLQSCVCVCCHFHHGFITSIVQMLLLSIVSPKIFFGLTHALDSKMNAPIGSLPPSPTVPLPNYVYLTVACSLAQHSAARARQVVQVANLSGAAVSRTQGVPPPAPDSDGRSETPKCHGNVPGAAEGASRVAVHMMKPLQPYPTPSQPQHMHSLTHPCKHNPGR